MERIWFTADTHFGHEGIMRRCNRPFAHVREMDDAIMSIWNGIVAPADVVYHLGDFCYPRKGRDAGSLLRKLNGRVILIQGNHDRQADIEAFGESYPYLELKINGVRICMSHYALRCWNESVRGSLHLYAHCHGRLPSLGRSMDVGVDTHDYQPYSIEEVLQNLLAKEPHENATG